MCDYGHLKDDAWLYGQRGASGEGEMREEKDLGSRSMVEPASDRGRGMAGSRGSGWVGDFGHLEGPR
jgi:hypothetical protein